LLIFGLGSLVVSLSGDFTMLLVGRAIQGFGASGIFPVASAVIGDIYPPKKRGRVLGIVGAVFGIAFIIGLIQECFSIPVYHAWIHLHNRFFPEESCKGNKYEACGMIY
jgi:MFS family permease